MSTNSNYLSQLIQTMKPHISMEIFMDNQVAFNVTKHKLVPKHRPMSAEEKKELLQK